MKRYKFTLIGFLFSVFLWLIIIVLELDFFEGLSGILVRIRVFEIDKLVLPLMLFIVFVGIDQIKNHRQKQKRRQWQKLRQRHIKNEAEKTKIYEAMLTANQHILNNFLNEMQIFKLTADETKGFPKEVIKLYDEIIESTRQQIEELSNLDKISEESINKAILDGISIGKISAN